MSAVIPASRFKRDGETAWVVFDIAPYWGAERHDDGPKKNLTTRPLVSPIHQWQTLDRPCDKCDGHQIFEAETSWEIPCNCINGRHLFPVGVEQIAYGEEYTGEPVACGTTTRTLTVSVVPGMVLPIYEFDQPRPPTPHISRDFTMDGVRVFDYWDGEHWHYDIALPSGAEPGEFVVKLLIHETAA